jgi:carbonic anhydrase/acetyltransferase-like protein (isoleucine patch superfamily)
MTLKHRLREVWWAVRWSSRATALFHTLAMWAPLNSWRLFFYRLRGVRIGKHVYVVQGTFLEESRPWLIEIHDGVRIGAGVIIATHDAVYHLYDTSIPHRYGKVVIKRNATICPGSILMPGVTVGENAVVAPGSLVIGDVPDGMIVSGSPAKPLMPLEQGLARSRPLIPKYQQLDAATKYPWAMDTPDLS